MFGLVRNHGAGRHLGPSIDSPPAPPTRIRIIPQYRSSSSVRPSLCNQFSATSDLPAPVRGRARRSGLEALDEPYAGFKLVVRGYDRGRGGPRFGAHAATVDGGCGFGGPLLAACFSSDGGLVDRLEA